MFNEARDLVKAVESHLAEKVGRPTPYLLQFHWPRNSITDKAIPLVDNAKSLFWLPTKFLHVGLQEISKRAILWLSVFFALIYFGSEFANRAGVPLSQYSIAVTLVAVIVPLFLAAFSMPSIYGDSGVSDSEVKFVVNYLRGRNFSSIDEIELLSKSVKLFDDRTRARVIFLKSVVGLLWASLIYFAPRSIDNTTLDPTVQMSDILLLMLVGIGIFVTYVCVWGYDAALKKLFRSIKFGCIDYCHGIYVSSSHESQPENNRK